MRKMEMEMEERQRKMEIEERQREKDKEFELELKKMEMEEGKEERQKDKELELRNKELEHKVSSQSTFDVSKHIRFVPLFQEKEVDIYFSHFEKIAENLKWPREHWTLLLQCPSW